MNTGLKDVNATSYLTQAREILTNNKKSTTQLTHPESYIRSVHLDEMKKNSSSHHKPVDGLNSKNDPVAIGHPEPVEGQYSNSETTDIDALVRGPLDMQRIDLYAQGDLHNLTMQVIAVVFKPNWIRTDTVKNLAKRYGDGYVKFMDNLDLEALHTTVVDTAGSVQEYLCYLLLDFARVDPELNDLPLAHIFEIAEALDLGDRLQRITRKELQLGVREFRELTTDAVKSLSEMTAAEDEGIYIE